MKKLKKVIALVLSVMVLSTGMTVFAAETTTEAENVNAQSEIQPRAGCGNWSKSYGNPYCSNQLCPGAFKRRLRNVYYHRTCVRDDGSIYPENRSEIEYVACNCY